jgi:hypothetical protein
MKCIAALFLLFTIARAFGDGAYKHLHLVEPAEIPQQSAVIGFAEGKETLTIWNTVEAKGQDLAWVLPLPAKPDLIRPSHPNAFKLLRWMTAPEVLTAFGRDGLSPLAAAVTLLFGFRKLRNDGHRRVLGAGGERMAERRRFSSVQRRRGEGAGELRGEELGVSLFPAENDRQRTCRGASAFGALPGGAAGVSDEPDRDCRDGAARDILDRISCAGAIRSAGGRGNDAWWR